MANQRKPRPLKSEAAPTDTTTTTRKKSGRTPRGGYHPSRELGYRYNSNYVYKPEYAQKVLDHCARGKPLETFGAKENVTTKTLQDWKVRYPEFGEALEMGRKLCLDYWIELGMQGAVGSQDFNPSTWQFFMKCLHKWNPNDVTLVQNNTQVNIDQSQTAVSISADEVKKALTADVFVETKSIESDE